MKWVDKASKERYRYLPDAESQVGYKDMKEFIETVKGAKLKEKLCIAITNSQKRRIQEVQECADVLSE